MASFRTYLLRAVLPFAAFVAATSTAYGFPGFDGDVLYEVKKFDGNGNYYMLVDRRFLPNGKRRMLDPSNLWHGARRLAQGFTYEGVRGRLVKLTSPQLESFIRITFRPGTDYWIGVRYNCKTNRMEYADGTPMPPGAYSHWHPVDWGPRTSVGTPLCTHLDSYLGAQIVVTDEREGYWALRGEPKGFFQFVVEFPVGEMNAAKETADASGADESN